MNFNISSIFLLFILCLSPSPSKESVIVEKSDINLFPLSIIHINDFHARFEETNWQSNSCKPEEGDECIGGYARVVTMVKQLKEELKDTNPIYLNAGDNFQGTLWYNLLKWEVTSLFLNELPADAMTIGNHEFDHKIEGLVPFLKAINSPIVVCNIDDSEEPTIQGLYEPYTIIERDGKQIGIIGVILSTTNTIAQTEKLKFLDESTSVAAQAQLLKNRGIDIIIVLSHCGLDKDKIIAANAGPYIDVIVGGHSHTFMYTGDEYPGPDKPYGKYPEVIIQENGHKVLVVQASAYTKYLGSLTVWFDENGEIELWEGKPIFLDSSVVPDPDIIKKLQPYKEEIDVKAKVLVGTSLVDLVKSDCSYGDCNIGNLIADAMVYGFIDQAEDSQHWSKGTIAITNNGGIRTSLLKGDVNYGDLKTVLPFDNTVDTFNLRGDYLWEVFEYSVARSMLQISGLKIIANSSLPEGRKIISIDVLCRKCKIPEYLPLNRNEMYNIIAISYIADGGSGFDVIKNHKENHEVGMLDIDAVEAYFKRMSPLFTPRDGRYTILK